MDYSFTSDFLSHKLSHKYTSIQEKKIQISYSKIHNEYQKSCSFGKKNNYITNAKITVICYKSTTAAIEQAFETWVKFELIKDTTRD